VSKVTSLNPLRNSKFGHGLEPKSKIRSRFGLMYKKKLMDEDSLCNLESKLHPPITFARKVGSGNVSPI